jgi:uncharacterized protein
MKNEIGGVIERYAELWVRGDTVSMVEYYNEDMKLHYFGRNGLAGVHEGKAAVLGILTEFSRRTDRALVRIVATMSGATRGAIIVQEMIGPDVDRTSVERLFVYSLRNGRFSECWVYDQDQALIDQVLGS